MSGAVSTRAPLASLADDYLQRLLRGDRLGASAIILDAVASGTALRDIYLHVFQPTQYEIGRLWQTNEITVADEHYCTAATQLTMSLLYARLFDSARDAKNEKPIVVSAVAGELHELGARMVADIIELEGWNTMYLGANTPADALVRTVSERRAPVVSISVTLVAHLHHVAELVNAIRTTPETKDVKVLVGGYALRSEPDSWKAVGADATARDALGAVEVIERFLSSPREG